MKDDIFDGMTGKQGVYFDEYEEVVETAKAKLKHGEMTEILRDTLRTIAFGEDLGQRARFERRTEELQDELRALREDKRELSAKIENVEQQIHGYQTKISNLSTREDRYEAKLESLEHRLRLEGQRLDIDHAAVKEVARSVQKEPDGVIEDLKQRNPDIPVYAFQDGLLDRKRWDGLPEEQAQLPVGER